MARIQKLFLLLTIVGPLHMIEQLLTNIEEFYMIRGDAARYYTWFDPASADWATVLLITIVWTTCSLMLYAVSKGGVGALALFGLFGFFGVTELHHVIEAIEKRGYDPGVITCIPYAIVGAQLLVAVWTEFQRRRTAPQRAVVTASIM